MPLSLFRDANFPLFTALIEIGYGILLIKALYQVVSAWEFDISTANYAVSWGWLIGFSYIPEILIVAIIIVIGLRESSHRPDTRTVPYDMRPKAGDEMNV